MYCCWRGATFWLEDGFFLLLLRRMILMLMTAARYVNHFFLFLSVPPSANGYLHRWSRGCLLLLNWRRTSKQTGKDVIKKGRGLRCLYGNWFGFGNQTVEKVKVWLWQSQWLSLWLILRFSRYFSTLLWLELKLCWRFLWFLRIWGHKIWKEIIRDALASLLLRSCFSASQSFKTIINHILLIHFFLE